jgi:hypothetical protein
MLEELALAALSAAITIALATILATIEALRVATTPVAAGATAAIGVCVALPA